MVKSFTGKYSLIAVACALFGAAFAEADTLGNLDVPAGELATALKTLADQADLNLVYQPEQLKDIQTQGLKGSYSGREAVEILLKGTQLRVYVTERGAMMIGPVVTGAVSEGEGALRVAQAEREAGESRVEEDAGVKLDEIVVTAQKREERLSDVPISISVLRGEELDRSTAQGVTEALNRIPGVTSTAALLGGATQLTVRGVTAANALFAGGNPIGYYLDSVPFGFVKSAIAPDSNAYDLDSIEVLRGPQGTLYGASALNGVVRVLTKNANLEEFEFKARTSGSTTADGGENYRGDVALNVPLIEGKLAARAVVGYQNIGGWIDKPTQNDFNDGQIRNYRLKLNAQPTDAFSVGLSGWVTRGDYGGPSQGDEERRNSFSLAEPVTSDYDAYNLNVGYDFGGFSVTSSTSKLDYSGGNDLDLFGTILFTGLDSDVFTEEVLVNSTAGDAWRWSLGGIYRDAEDRTFQYFRSPGGPRVAELEWRDRSKSYAVFGEATRRFSDGKFEITAGLRYFEDDLESQEGTPGLAPALRVNPKFDAVTPRAVLTWHPSDRNTLYTSYSEGFRSGFDQFLLAKTLLNLPPVEPDTLKNYEVGAKGSAGDGLLSYEAAVYFIDWQDVQQALSIIVDGIPRAANMNGGSASGLGVDLAAAVRPLDGLEFAASFSWNDLAFDEDVPSGAFILFAEGDRLANSPEYSATVSADYNFPFGGNGFRGRLSASANYVSEQRFVTLLATPYAAVGDSLLMGRAGFAVESPAHWIASLFVDNVMDEDGAPIAAQFAVPDWSIRVRPRTVGLQLEYQFED